MAKFKRQDHYYVWINGQPIEVSEEVYRVMLLADNQERRHTGYFLNKSKKLADGTWKTAPSWLVSTEEYSGTYKLSGPEELEPERRFERNYTARILKEAVSTLPKTYSTVINMLYYEGLTQVMAAQRLGISQPLLFYYKKKAIAALHEILDSQGLSFEDFLQAL